MKLDFSNNKKMKQKNIEDELIRNFKATQIIIILDNKTIRGCGHSGIVLLDDKKNGIYYGAMVMGNVVKALTGQDVNLFVARIILSNSQVNKLFYSGRIKSENKNFSIEDKICHLINSELKYDEYISIPLKNPEDGKRIIETLEFKRSNPGIYNIFDRNCGHFVQEVLKDIDLDFSKTKSDKAKELKPEFDKAIHYLFTFRFKKSNSKVKAIIEKIHEFEISPTSQYKKGIEMAKERKYEHDHIRKLNRAEFKKYSNIVKSVDYFIGKEKLLKYINFYELNKDKMNSFQINMCKDFISKQRKLHVKRDEFLQNKRGKFDNNVKRNVAKCGLSHCLQYRV